MTKLFLDRVEAGQQLAEHLIEYADRQDVMVLALPRGGVPVAFEVAKKLKAPLDVILVRKLGTPYQEELAMGAISSDGVTILNQDLIHELGISSKAVNQAIAREEKEIQRRLKLYRPHHEPLDVKGKVVILIDDGIATGSTMLAAIEAVKTMGAQKIVIATPIAPPDTIQQLHYEADQVVCLYAPERLYAIGNWYEDFTQTSDQEVQELLTEARDFVAL